MRSSAYRARVPSSRRDAVQLAAPHRAGRHATGPQTLWLTDARTQLEQRAPAEPSRAEVEYTFS